VHVGTDALPTADAGVGAGDPADVSAETPAPADPVPGHPADPVPGHPADPVPGHPADPARCHVEDGPAISVSTADMIGCTAALSWMRHGRGGEILDLGRRRRRPNAALRRAARERDKCRCRFPGCESRRVDLHHIQHWASGGHTKLDNLISLCKYHHMLVHDRGYLIIARPGGAFAFSRPDGMSLPSSPALPGPQGAIGDYHDADITPDTILPAWYGERLNLDHAIYVCLANEANQARQDQRARQDRQEEHQPFRPKPGPSEPSDWIAWILNHSGDHATA
jgi:hypothetical protein